MARSSSPSRTPPRKPSRTPSDSSSNESGGFSPTDQSQLESTTSSGWGSVPMGAHVGRVPGPKKGKPKKTKKPKKPKKQKPKTRSV